jgi:hypothetical protein
MNLTKENIRKFLGWSTVINLVLRFVNFTPPMGQRAF